MNPFYKILQFQKKKKREEKQSMVILDPSFHCGLSMHPCSNFGLKMNLQKPNKSKLCCVKIKTLHFWNLVGILLIWFSKKRYEGLVGYLVQKALTTHCVEISI